MQNLGNTCYFNTALQCLLHVPVLTNHFMLKGYQGECIFTKEYKKIVDHIWVHKKKNVINPSEMLKEFRSRYPQFRGSEPNDVQETVLCIIDIFEASLGKEWMKKHFYGKMSQTITWDNGSKESVDDFSCHTVDLGDEFTKKSTEIEDYEDDKGERWPKAKIDTHISHMGSVFMINFNLYQEKQLVKVPERIEGYKLIAAALHMGSRHGGHYAAIVKHRNDWYICDDEMKIKAEHYNETGPYYFAIYTKSSSS